MTDPILSNPPKNQNRAHPPRQLTTHEALVIAWRACSAIRTGEPDPLTFERDDLAQAMAVLGQMMVTLERRPTK